ncbi:ATPase, partial [Candidatus Woesearchaeota archaeon]|nr:ATPase [Candidatus Woesearchaeota archaeon]
MDPTNDIKKVKQEIARVVVGQDEIVDSLLRAILADGHVIVEGVPGIAKTLLIRTLAVVTGCSFKRIQFTVDLLPTDITGITSYNEQKGFYV